MNGGQHGPSRREVCSYHHPFLKTIRHCPSRPPAKVSNKPPANSRIHHDDLELILLTCLSRVPQRGYYSNGEIREPVAGASGLTSLKELRRVAILPNAQCRDRITLFPRFGGIHGRSASMNSNFSSSFSRRCPDSITDELVAVLSAPKSYEFKALFLVIQAALRARNTTTGGEEILRLRAYEKLQNPVQHGQVRKTDSNTKACGKSLLLAENLKTPAGKRSSHYKLSQNREFGIVNAKL